MRTPQRVVFLVADGALVGVLLWRWASGHTPHRVIDAATVLTLVLGFFDAARAARRSLRGPREAAAGSDVERRDALWLFPAEDPVAGATLKPPTQPSFHRPPSPPWLTILAGSVLMIVLTWRWAFRDEPYTLLGALTLSTLMLGFLGTATTALESLGRAGRPPASGRRPELHDDLLLFPAEES